MAQKSILSFFKHTEKPSTPNVLKDSLKSSVNGHNSPSSYEIEPNPSTLKIDQCENDSPVKKSSKRKRLKQIIESDDESEVPNTTPKSVSKKTKEMTNVKHCKDDSEEDSDEKKNPASKSKSNNALGNECSKKSVKRKRKQITDSDEDNSTISTKKEKKGKDKDVNIDKDLDKSIELNRHAKVKEVKDSTSEVSAPPEFISQKLTARKQVKSSKPLKAISSIKVKDKQTGKGVSSGSCSKSPGSPAESKVKEGDEKKENILQNICDDTTNVQNSEKDSSESDESHKTVEQSPLCSKKIHPFFAKKEEKPEDKLYSSQDTGKCSSKEEVVIKNANSPVGSQYDPTASRYNPIDNASWKKGEKVPYLALAKTLELIEKTSGRLKTIEILSNFFRSVIVLSPDDFLHSIYLCLNRLAPEYEGIELGIGDTILMKALAHATGRTMDKIKAEVASKGDLGLVAESSRGHQKLMFAPPKLSVSSVFYKFKEIAQMTGNASMAKKIDKIQALFVACRECEAKYIIRSLSGKLRIGLAEQSILAAISRAAVLTPPDQDYPPEVIDKSSGMSTENFKKLLDAQTLILKTTYCECPNYDAIVPVLLKEGIEGLPKHCHLQPGCPLKPMLAHPTAGIEEVLKRFDKNKFTCEYKYDGERAQIHMTEDGDVKIFSRNQENNTTKYPDVIKRISKALCESTKSFILDSEAVAWDCESKQILPFQVLSTRKKKDAVESEIAVQVCIMCFDLLYLNGESLVKRPLNERRELLHSSFKEIENEFTFAIYKDGESAETMQEFLDESLKDNCEGLMVKALEVDASYEIAKRSHNWLKLKKDYLNGVGDTLDLVVIGGYHGKGKRVGCYGGFLLACFDNENEEFQSICKLGTGFDEPELKAHTKFLKQHVIDGPKSYYRYDQSLEPDEWFEPVQIWEVKCADLSISPIHRAAIGIVDPEKGISLRFPRFVRIRDDKSKPEDATNSSQVAEFYQNQQQVQNTKNTNNKNEEDFY